VAIAYDFSSHPRQNFSSNRVGLWYCDLYSESPKEEVFQVVTYGADSLVEADQRQDFLEVACGALRAKSLKQALKHL
jgi:hypothetical protein